MRQGGRVGGGECVGGNNSESFREAQQGKFTSLKCVERSRKESRMIS